MTDAIAYMTLDEEGTPLMLFFDRAEAETHCNDDEGPIPLVVLPDTDKLANFMREIDGDHKIGTGVMAERIVDWLREQSNDRAIET